MYVRAVVEEGASDRDLTFPIVLVMGFKPAPTASLGRGIWAAELDLIVSDSFQVSSWVEDYLCARGGEIGLGGDGLVRCERNGDLVSPC